MLACSDGAVTKVDWAVLAAVAVFAMLGWRSGFIGGAMSLLGFVLGAMGAAWVTPLLLPAGEQSPYAPLLALLGAAVGGALLASFFERIGSGIRRALPIPFIGAADRGLGSLLGGAVGIGIVWLLAIVLVQLPGAESLRSGMRASRLIQALGTVMPPTSEIVGIVGRFDPLPVVGGVSPSTLSKPRAEVLGRPAITAARDSVVRVRASSCGFGIEGSGWVAADGLVVTNAHVVAGDPSPVIELRGEGFGTNSKVVVFDRRNDIAVLSVPGFPARPLRLAEASPGSQGAVLGYPLNGGYSANEITVGRTLAVLGEDAYAKGPIQRTVVVLRGLVRPGNSGGPVVDQAGRSVGTVYGKTDNGGGFAVPSAVVRSDLERARSGRVDPVGPCSR